MAVSASRIQLLVDVAEDSARVRRAGAMTVCQSAELTQSLSVLGARSFLRGNPVLRITPASRQGCQRTLRVCRLRWRREGGAAQRRNGEVRSCLRGDPTSDNDTHKFAVLPAQSADWCRASRERETQAEYEAGKP